MKKSLMEPQHKTTKKPPKYLDDNDNDNDDGDGGGDDETMD